jgi:type VI secretion system protein VasD
MINRHIVPASFVVAALLSGCGDAPPPPPPPGILDLTIAADQDINPDDRSRPSPVIVTLYQLSAKGAFSADDYFELSDGKQIAQDLMARDQISINPGERKTLSQPVKDNAQFFAIVASFQQIDKAAWKAVVQIPAHGTTNITAHLTGKTVILRSDLSER